MNNYYKECFYASLLFLGALIGLKWYIQTPAKNECHYKKAVIYRLKAIDDDLLDLSIAVNPALKDYYEQKRSRLK